MTYVDTKCNKYFKSKINVLSLLVLETISDDLALYLGQHFGSLILGVKYFTAQQLSLLLYHDGRIWFKGLERLDPEGFEILAKFDCKLQLDNLSQLTPDAAAKLSKHKRDLSLYLSEITEDVLRALVKHEGLSLSFGNAHMFNEESFKILSTYQKYLDFSNVGNLTAEKARYFLNYPSGLQFHWVETMEEEALQILKTAKYLHVKMSNGEYYNYSNK